MPVPVFLQIRNRLDKALILEGVSEIIATLKVIYTLSLPVWNFVK